MPIHSKIHKSSQSIQFLKRFLWNDFETWISKTLTICHGSSLENNVPAGSQEKKKETGR
jgi:hypothetical protein